MIDLDEELTEYGTEWRAAQPPLPHVTIESAHAPRRRARWALVAAMLVVVLALGAVVLVTTRSHDSTPPTVGTPTTVDTSEVPKLDVVPLYLPIDAADMRAVAAVRERISVPTSSASRTPTHAEQVQQSACSLMLQGGAPGSTYDFEDPSGEHGAPAAPSVEPPPPPSTAPRCTTSAAHAAARARTIVRRLAWLPRVPALDADPTVAAAKQQDIQCLHDQGIDMVAPDGYVGDGYNAEHPDQQPQTRLTFADCFAQVVDARAPVRAAFRTSFVVEHREQIDALQAAFDDYLRAVYAPAPRTKTVTTLPDQATWESGCVRVGPVDRAMPPIDSADALAIARVRLHDSEATPSQSLLGPVTVCDLRLRNRLAWTFEFPGRVVVIDAANGAMLLNRTVSAD